MEPNKKDVLNQVEECLDKLPEYCVPLQKIHSQLSKLVKENFPSLEELEKLCQQDPRFDFISGQPAPSGFSPTQLKKAGIEVGPRVGLKSRRPKPQEVAKKMQEQAQRILDSLQKAYDTRPLNGEEADEIEARLLKMLKRAQTIRDTIKKARIS